MKPREQKYVPKRSSVILIIALLLISSATARLFGGTATVIAREVDSFLAVPAEMSTDDLQPTSDALDSILAELRERQEALDVKEMMVAERQRSVDALSRATQEKLVALKQAEEDLRKTINIANKAADSDIKQLVAVYENMKPADAALVFEEMDHRFAAGFLSQMRADVAAKIVQGLEPATAYSISVILAGRNVDVASE